MASLIYNESCKGVKEVLDLSSVLPTRTSLQKGSYVEYHPVSSLSSVSHIEFVVPGESSSYINLLNTLLYVRERIKKQDGTVLVADSNGAPVCNLLQAL